MPLSGVFWTHRFAASTSLDDLEPNFQHCVRRFLDAISSARAGLVNANVVAIPNVHARPGAPNGAARAHGLAGAARAGAVAGVHDAHAHPRYKVNNTFRPAQRAYLMHYCWLISRSRIDPDDVPAYQPIGDARPGRYRLGPSRCQRKSRHCG
jgi:hypothetical protein